MTRLRDDARTGRAGAFFAAVCAGFLIALLIAAAGPAQASGELPRKGSLGVQAQGAPGGGVTVVGVQPGSAAEEAGVQQGDVILSLNGVPTPTVPAFIGAASGLEVGKPVPMSVRRGGESLELEVSPKPRPAPTLEGTQITLSHVTLDNGNRMRTFTVRPDSALPSGGTRPGMFLIGGIPCQSMESFANPNHPMTKLIKRAADAGFAVLVVDKPGTGDSEGIPCLEGGFDREVEAFVKGLAAFKAESDVDAERIHLVGISMGGIQAPLVAQQSPVKGIVTWGTGVQPWFDYIATNFRERFHMQNQPPAVIDQVMRTVRDYMARLIILGQTPEEILAEVPALHGAMEASFGPGSATTFAGRHYTFHQEIDKHDIGTAWAAFGASKGNAAIVHGEYDWVATERDHKLAADIVNRTGGAAVWIMLEGLDHGFTKHETLADSFANAFQGEPSDAFQDAAIKWLKTQEGL